MTTGDDGMEPLPFPLDDPEDEKLSTEEQIEKYWPKGDKT